MPNSLSTAKRHRQSLVRRERNRVAKSQIRTSIRQFEKFVSENKTEEAKNQLKEVFKLLDSSVNKKIFHLNTVARKKSRLYKKLSPSS